MVFAAEFGVGQVLWSIFWFFLFFMWIWLVISIFGDIIRSDDMSGVAKAIWAALIVFLPYLGVFAYLIVRGGSMGERQLAAARAQEQAVDSYIRETAGGGGRAQPISWPPWPSSTRRARSTTPSSPWPRPRSSTAEPVPRRGRPPRPSQIEVRP